MQTYQVELDETQFEFPKEKGIKDAIFKTNSGS